MSAAWLTAGMTVCAGTMNSVPGHRDGGAPAGGIRLAEAVAHELDARDLAVLVADHLDRTDEELHPHAFALRLAQLLLVHDELGARAPVGDRHVGGAMAEAGARAVHRGVAAADDDHVVAHLERLAQVGLLHELDAVLDAVQLLARHVQRHRIHGAGA